jgi:hypothetical protein
MDRNKFPLLFTVFTTLALVGCGLSPTQEYPEVSLSDTNAFLHAMEVNRKEAAVKRAQMLDLLVEYWVQPANIAEPCKVMVVADEVPETTIYWDGRCDGGYAKGLGRAFLDSDHGLTGWLEEYPGGPNTPKTHYAVAYDYNRVSVGFAPDGGAREKYAHNNPNGFSVCQGYRNRDEVNGVEYNYHTCSKNDFSTWSLAYADGSSLKLDQSSDPSVPLDYVVYYQDKDGKSIGYAVEVYRNGTARHVSWIGGQKSYVRLPSAFTFQMQEAVSENLKKLNEAYQAAEKSQVALEIYKRRTCKGDVAVSYMDSELYGQICLEYGDLSKFSSQMAAAESEVLHRQEANKDRALRQQEIAADRAVAQASRDNANAASQAAEIQSFSNSMTESAQNMAAFTNSMIMSNHNNNSPSIGLTPERRVVNCFQAGSIVSCQ